MFVAEDSNGRLDPGEGERDLPRVLSLVLTYGGPTPDRANQPAVLDGGGIVVRMTRQGYPPDPRMSSSGRRVPVRGTYGVVSTATSITTGATYRSIHWVVQDGGAFVTFLALDDPAHRSLDDLVHLLDALGEA